MPAGISLTRIGNVKTSEGRSLEVLVKRDIADKLTKRHKHTLDVLHNAVQVHPKTGKIIKDSLASVVRPANRFFAKLLGDVATTVNSEEAFPQTVKTTGAKSLRVGGLGYKTETWHRLTKLYLQRIGAGPGRRGRTRRGSYADTSGTKRFWYEQRRTGSKAKQTSPMGETAAERLVGLAGVLQNRFTTGEATSKRGRLNTFSISSDIKRRRARTHTRKGARIPIYGVTGTLYGPSKLSIAGDMSVDFTKIMVQALMTGQDQTPEKSPKQLFAGAAQSRWAAILLTNEWRRPWISRYFARNNPRLVAYIQQALIAQHGRK